MTEQREQIVLSAYRSGKTCRQIVKDHGIATNEVAAILRKHGIQPRTGRPPTCSVDHTAFDSLTPTSAYWTGFLFADGSIAYNKSGSPQLILELGKKDQAHLKMFARDFLKSEHTIRNVMHWASTYGSISVPDRESVAFRVRSKQLVDMLVSYGLVADKKKRVPSDILTNSCDFWRGCIDGDGTVRLGVDKNGYLYGQIQLCGRRLLIEKYQSFLNQNGITTTITRTASKIFQIQTVGAKSVAIARMLYRDAKVALQRKMEAAQKILDTFDGA